MRKRFVCVLATIALLQAASVPAQQAEEQFQQARTKEIVSGDLEGAIRIYADIAASRGTSAELAALSLLESARLHEALGRKEQAVRVLNLIVGQHADQKEISAKARQRLAALAPAAEPGRISANLMTSIRAATFEVVLKKPEVDPLQYEKPLPLELLPFAERNDQYESIGTAFAIGPGSFVTAAHVADAASGGMRGVPALRDARGRVYPIDRVTRFSLHEDFIVFTVAGMPQVTSLRTSTAYRFDTPVIAVGNALGEGIVARDGVLTSETSEADHGRWKWLRFSAPASPGNSGGPLLDGQGRVIGLIARKSANENLNYALPIARVLNAPTTRGSVYRRDSVGLPFMSARKVVTLEADIELPLGFAEFARQLVAIDNRHGEAARRQLLQESAADIFPRGNSSRLLADSFSSYNPALITQQADGSWDAARAAATAGRSTQLGSDGEVWTSPQAGVLVFRVQYSDDPDVAKSRGDGRLLAEQVLKGYPLQRDVGGEKVRVTSLGAASPPVEFRDDVGRLWQQWRWSLSYAHAMLILTALPTPDGYAGFLSWAGEAGVENEAAEARLLTNFMQAAYRGTLPQWRAFLADEHLRPQSFQRWQVALDPAGEVSLELPRLAIKVDREVLNVSERPRLVVYPGTLLDGDRPEWDVLTVLFIQGRSSTLVTATRRARPAPDAGREALARWELMTLQQGPYSGSVRRTANSVQIGSVAVGDGVSPAEASVLYELTYLTVAGEEEAARAAARLPQMFRVREK